MSGGLRRARPRRLRMLLRGAAASVALAMLTGCTTLTDRPTPAPTAQPSGHVANGWTSIPLPSIGARVLVLLHDGVRMLALGSVPHSGHRAPAAWSTEDLVHWQTFAVHAATGYGRVAEFTMAASSGGRVVAWGQAFGGSHSNPRPTIWTADATSLREHEQPFSMFGGEDALSTDAEAARDGTTLLAGSWKSGSGRYGATVWLSRSGATWTRHADLAGLESEPGEQTSALGAAATRAGFALVGASAHYGRPGPPSTPLAWFSTGASGWSRVVLPTTASAVASRVACSAGSCVELGSTLASDQHLLCWRTDATGRVTGASDGPGHGLVEVTDAVRTADRIVAIVDIDRVAQLYSVGTDCSGWIVLPLPAKAETAVLAGVDGRMLLATTGDGTSRLWVRDPASTR
jgi:hypothetical protein